VVVVVVVVVAAGTSPSRARGNFPPMMAGAAVVGATAAGR